MELSITGKLIECVKNESKKSDKTYFSLQIYKNGTLYRIGVPMDVYLEFKPMEGEEVTVEGIRAYSESRISYFIPDNIVS